MNEQSVTYTHDGILLFGLKKEWNSDTGCNMDEPLKKHRFGIKLINKPKTKGKIL